jgi:transposase-like protein
MARTKLTEKQEQVYDILKTGKDPKEIASDLGVSKAAIYSHIRAIKDGGHPVPAKYANVGTGRGGGRPARKATGRKSSSRPATPAPAPEAPVLTAAPQPEPAAADGLNIDEVFAALTAQIKEDQANIEVRRGQIRSEIETLDERKARLQDEDAQLEIALARLAGTANSIDATPDSAAAAA